MKIDPKEVYCVMSYLYKNNKLIHIEIVYVSIYEDLASEYIFDCIDDMEYHDDKYEYNGNELISYFNGYKCINKIEKRVLK